MPGGFGWFTFPNHNNQRTSPYFSLLPAYQGLAGMTALNAVSLEANFHVNRHHDDHDCVQPSSNYWCERIGMHMDGGHGFCHLSRFFNF